MEIMKFYDWLIMLAMIIVCAFIVAWAFGEFTGKICDKTYSPEFKKTQQYKSMQCPT